MKWRKLRYILEEGERDVEDVFSYAKDDDVTKY